jgi:hypothetical protein
MADQQEPYSAFSKTFENIPTAEVYDTSPMLHPR